MTPDVLQAKIFYGEWAGSFLVLWQSKRPVYHVANILFLYISFIYLSEQNLCPWISYVLYVPSIMHYFLSYSTAAGIVAALSLWNWISKPESIAGAYFFHSCLETAGRSERDETFAYWCSTDTAPPPFPLAWGALLCNTQEQHMLLMTKPCTKKRDVFNGLCRCHFDYFSFLLTGSRVVVCSCC